MFDLEHALDLHGISVCDWRMPPGEDIQKTLTVFKFEDGVIIARP
jgi:hypothetical protein